MSRLKKRALALLAIPFVGVMTLTGCITDSAATVGSENLRQAADNFELNRRIVFFNGITDTNLLEIQGRCSITDQGNQLEVICLTGTSPSGESMFKRHFLGLSDNVSYFVEQLEAIEADPFHYRVIFRPEVIVPDIEIETSGDGDSPTGP